MIEVWFLAAPIQEVLDLQEALDGYRREIYLAALGAGDPAVPPPVPEDLVEIRRALDEVHDELYVQAREARREGLAVADLAAHYPKISRAVLLAVMDASTGADAAARSGVLLAPPLTDSVRDVHQWLYRELRTQLDGAAPRPYRPPA